MNVKSDPNKKAIEKLRRIGERFPELAPLLNTCRTVEEIEEAIQELRKLGW